MTGTVTILGANGRLGHVACETFIAKGWQTRGFVRAGREGGLPDGVEPVDGNGMDEDELADAMSGATLIVNAMAPEYTNWEKEFPKMTKALLRALEATGVPQILPGNVYPYGLDMPAVITEDAAQEPRSRKGRVRRDLEDAFRTAASEQGLKTIIIRAGDFFGAGAGGWLDEAILKEAGSGTFRYPGKPDLEHAWAYLPDFAAAIEALAHKVPDLPAYASYGFAGHTLTGHALHGAAEAALDRKLAVKSMPWTAMTWLGLFNPMLRELVEMQHLWDQPHRIDGTALEALIGPLPHTPLNEAVAAAIAT
ncbi:MAG: NAD(P)H-binding protein [Pseudomonadota bacterium]